MNKRSIQILRGTQTFDPTTSAIVLEDGQPFISHALNRLYVGDGTTPLHSLNSVSLEYDDVPTDGSHNNISSGAVYKALVELNPKTKYEIRSGVLYIDNEEVSLRYSPLGDLPFDFQVTSRENTYVRFVQDLYLLTYGTSFSFNPNNPYIRIDNPYYDRDDDYRDEFPPYILDGHIELEETRTVQIGDYALASIEYTHANTQWGTYEIRVTIIDENYEADLNTMQLSGLLMSNKTFVVNNLDHASPDNVCALSAYQGHVLNNKIDSQFTNAVATSNSYTDSSLVNYISVDTYNTKVSELEAEIERLQTEVTGGLPVELIGF